MYYLNGLYGNWIEIRARKKKVFETECIICTCYPFCVVTRPINLDFVITATPLQLRKNTFGEKKKFHEPTETVNNAHNWNLWSISSTFYARIFCTKVLCIAFFYLHATREKLPKRLLYKKGKRKTLMKLKPRVLIKFWIWKTS